MRNQADVDVISINNLFGGGRAKAIKSITPEWEGYADLPPLEVGLGGHGRWAAGLMSSILAHAHFFPIGVFGMGVSRRRQV